MRTVCGQFCGIFGGFRSCWTTLARALSVPGRSFVFGCQKLHCRGLRTSVRSAQMCIFCDFSRIFLFFRGGSNMVAFRTNVDGTWQAKFSRRLRHRVTGLRPSGLPNLPFSLVLSFPPSSSLHLPFLFFSQMFSLFSLFPHPFSFFIFFPQFSSNFPSPPLTSRFFQRFLVKATRLHVTPLSAMCPTRHLPHTGRDML